MGNKYIKVKFIYDCQFARIPVVLPNSHRCILPMPDEKGSAECVSIGMFVLVLLTSRYQDDHPAHHPDHGILVAWQEYPSFYGEGR